MDYFVISYLKDASFLKKEKWFSMVQKLVQEHKPTQLQEEYPMKPLKLVGVQVAVEAFS